MIFTVLLQIQHEVIIFLLPVNTNKPKLVTFLDKLFLCTTASFIAQISSSETRRHLGLVRKAMNSQKDTPSYGTQSKRAKIAIHCFGKYL